MCSDIFITAQISYHCTLEQSLRFCAKVIFRVVLKNSPAALENLLFRIVFFIKVQDPYYRKVVTNSAVLSFSSHFRTVPFFYIAMQVSK